MPMPRRWWNRLPPLWSDRDILCNLCPAFVSFFSRLNRTRSSAVAERPRDASCLSVVSFNTPTTLFLLPVTAASDLLVHKILLWLGYPMVKKFRRYLYSFWCNSRTWQTQTDGQTPQATLMHRIVRQKRRTSIVQRKLTKVDCSDITGGIFIRVPVGPGRCLALTAAALVYFANRRQLRFITNCCVYLRITWPVAQISVTTTQQQHNVDTRTQAKPLCPPQYTKI